ncbi:Type IV pilus retractation ATPase PilT [Gammaproteobacteria bacterium]
MEIILTVDVKKLLIRIVERRGSDLHLSSGMPPMCRVDGDLLPLENTAPIFNNELLEMLKAIVPPKLLLSPEENNELDFSLDLPDVARCRVNIFQQMNGVSAVFRIVPLTVPTLKDLMMPPTLQKLCKLNNGIVLVTGPTGSGKSTTLAAMIDYINQTEPCHIITIEDPIEFVYQSKLSLIQQREVHRHTASFNSALRASLREDPDVILVGEMRDIETIRLALTAAETGHLVFATLHTSSAPKTINRIVDVFPNSEKELVRIMLADSLQAVIAQNLIKRKKGGRVAILEILLSTPAVSNLIRENKIPQLKSVLQTGQGLGMRSYEQSMKELVAAGIVDPTEAVN